MKFVKVRCSKRAKKDVKKLYIEAFPKEERFPFIYLLYKEKRGHADFIALYDKGVFIGLLYLVYHKDNVFLFFFAVDKFYRGRGYGSKILKALLHKFNDKKVMLFIETTKGKYENIEERINRKHFYEKNGFKDAGFEITEKGVTYELMCSKNELKIDEVKSLVKKFFGRFLYYMYYEK